MAILPGYEYDVFISYRHNDNRSGWVTEFVKALQEELAATIKEPVSVYFDTNPHDGLLESHDVGDSLKEKLRCLIFIPIISQTYCDPTSFAWRNEFLVFKKLASEDPFGLKIKLHNGNVTGRILPIKIHDIDADDKATVENEIGGVLRAIEFIQKSGGVNRPLNFKDDEVRTVGKILYRDQVNKVANAIKEIITAIKNPAPSLANFSQQPSTGSSRSRKPVIISLAVLLIIISGYFILQRQTSKNEHSTLDKSIAVLPFINISKDPDQEYFSDGLSEELLNRLAQVPGLKVTGRTSSFAFKGKQEDLRTIGEKLGLLCAHYLDPDNSISWMRVEFRKYAGDDRYIRAMRKLKLSKDI